MRKKILLAFLAGMAAVAVIGLTVQQNNGIFIFDQDNTIKLSMRSGTAQTQPFIDCYRWNTAIFQVTSNGLIANSPGFTSGFSTNINVLTSDGLTNQMQFTNGVLWAVTHYP